MGIRCFQVFIHLKTLCPLSADPVYYSSQKLSTCHSGLMLVNEVIQNANTHCVIECSVNFSVPKRDTIPDVTVKAASF